MYTGSWTSKVRDLAPAFTACIFHLLGKCLTTFTDVQAISHKHPKLCTLLLFLDENAHVVYKEKLKVTQRQSKAIGKDRRGCVTSYSSGHRRTMLSAERSFQMHWTKRMTILGQHCSLFLLSYCSLLSMVIFFFYAVVWTLGFQHLRPLLSYIIYHGSFTF